jgi:hypothetical protein
MRALDPRQPRKPDVGTPEDWARIEAELGFKDVDLLRRERLWRELRSPFKVYRNLGGLPDWRIANFTRALDQLEEDATRLYNDISLCQPASNEDLAELLEIYETSSSDEELDNRLNARSLARAAQQVARQPFTDFNDNDALGYIADKLLPDDKGDSLRAVLTGLISDIDAARRQLGNDPTGRRGDWRLEATIHAIARVYYDETGRRPGVSRTGGVITGPFVRFVKAVFGVFAPERLKGDEALAQLIRRAKKRGWPGKHGN